MGIGTGIVLFAAGAILTWAVDVDLPYVSDDALGLILMLVGVIAVVAGGLMSSRSPQTGYGAGIMSIAAGAIVIWAVDLDLPYVADDALGIILLLAGAVAVAISAVANARHPQTGIGTGVVLLVAGAVLTLAVDLELPYVADYTLGAILLVAGVAAVAAGVVVHQRRSRPRMSQYYGQPYRY